MLREPNQKQRASGSFQSEPDGPAPPPPADATRGRSGIKAPRRRLASTCPLHGGDTDRPPGGQPGAPHARTTMVYTAALLFGHGVPVLTEDESVAQMIGKLFSQRGAPGPAGGSGSARRGSVDSWDERDSNPPFADLDAGLEHEERLLQQDVARQIELCLTEAKASTLHCRALLLPRHMTARVGQDVWRSSADEPCGLRGASIKVYVEGKDGLKPVGSIFPDPSVTPTFELSVIFRADTDGGWPPLMTIFHTSKVLKLRPEYRLVKRKLYSSASPVVHDFN